MEKNVLFIRTNIIYLLAVLFLIIVVVFEQTLLDILYFCVVFFYLAKVLKCRNIR